MLDGLSKLKGAASLLVAPLMQGMAMGLLCSFGVEIQKSFIGQALLPTLLKESVKLTAGLLPTLLAPYTLWIMLGIPALLMAYPFLSILLNRSFSISQAGEVNYAAYTLVSWMLPLGVFAKSMQMGLTFAASWYMAVGFAAFTSAYWLTLRPVMSSLRPPPATVASPPANNVPPSAPAVVPLERLAPTFTPTLQNTIRSNPPALENRQRSANMSAFTLPHRPS